MTPAPTPVTKELSVAGTWGLALGVVQKLRSGK
jgi:hypothetical protein